MSGHRWRLRKEEGRLRYRAISRRALRLLTRQSLTETSRSTRGDPTMSRHIIGFALAAVLLLPSIASTQATSADVIKQQGSGPIARGVTFPMPSDLHYRIAWGVNVGPTKPDSVVSGFRQAASF